MNKEVNETKILKAQNAGCCKTKNEEANQPADRFTNQADITLS